MNIKEELLALKQINFAQKVVLAIIEGQEISMYKEPCRLTCGEIGKLIGISRGKTSDIFWELEELGLIKTEVIDRTRETKVTALYKRITKKEKDIINENK